MARARILSNKRGLLALAGYAPLSQILTFIDWQGRGWSDELSTVQANKIVGREVGKFASRPLNYAVRVDTDEISLAILEAMFLVINATADDVEVVSYPAFVKLPDSAGAPTKDINDDVPLFIPNSEIEEVRVKWVDWKDETHHHLNDGGFTYIPTNSDTGANDIAVSRLIQLISQGYDVQPMSAWPALL